MNSVLSDVTARAGINVHQYYTLEVTGTPGAALADIYSFEGTSGMGVHRHPQRPAIPDAVDGVDVAQVTGT
ncbi:hypothetical protein [Paraburkholderia antibiotica]|uniref:Uncharacterized protein n=1 Tax=Paraburkholderia antibiotica TaxID=2728839 RepID=A0A7Y0A1I9_9BURK|nr:hypothetical protein [Paraburkholderia antibiotica]NML34806.1 hypothetical protein [Paraburkholderia antibiotica]